jgi:hypothetical protein
MKLACLIIFAAVFLISCLARAHADEIVTLYTTDSDSGGADRLASLGDFVAWKVGATTLKEIAVYRTEAYEVSAGGSHAKVQGSEVWASIFDVFNIRPMLGRAFLPAEKEQSQSKVAILSYELWQTTFHGDPAVIGEAILVDGEKRTVVGVMPKSMDAVGLGKILTPFVPGNFEGGGYDRGFHIIASLKPGVTIAEAQADLDLLDQKRHRDEPHYLPGWSARVAYDKQL